jgi:adenosylcobinamide-GDP ribazoletransferase
MKSFLLMLTFLTRIPIIIKFDFDDKTFKKGIYFFPIIGIIVGSFLGIIVYLTKNIGPDYKGFLVILAYLVVTGGLHLDGLADVCDGIFSCRKRERIFEIMSDSHIGTFGVIGLVLYFLGFWIGAKEITWQVALLFPVVGRCIGVCVCGWSTYAKASGMGKSLVTYTKVRHSLYAVVLGSIMTFFCGLEVFIAYLITLGLSFVVLKRIHNILDGITGDVIGFMMELSQIIFLLSIGIGVWK